MNFIKPTFYEEDNIMFEIFPHETLMFVDNTDNIFYIETGNKDVGFMTKWEITYDSLKENIKPVNSCPDNFSIDSDEFLKHSFGWFRKRVNLGLLPLEQEVTNVLEEHTIYPMRTFMDLVAAFMEDNHLRFNSGKQSVEFYSLGRIIKPELLDNMVKGLKQGFLVANHEVVPTTTKGENLNEENKL